jgi:hypothetical protein
MGHSTGRRSHELVPQAGRQRQCARNEPDRPPVPGRIGGSKRLFRGNELVSAIRPWLRAVAATSATLGDPLDPATMIGPIACTAAPAQREASVSCDIGAARRHNDTIIRTDRCTLLAFISTGARARGESTWHITRKRSVLRMAGPIGGGCYDLLRLLCDQCVHQRRHACLPDALLRAAQGIGPRHGWRCAGGHRLCDRLRHRPPKRRRPQC